MPPVFSAAIGEDGEAIVALLRSASLPFSDIQQHLPTFIVARDPSIIGVVGLEVYGATALLRSLVVDDKYRSRGIASELCKMAERSARDRGVRALYLLTSTARIFFEHRGWSVTPRGEAPTAIQNSLQFTSLCPNSATCMMKRIAQRLDSARS